ncbi:uncharacterized protein KY384_005771 [Bacidia gigantensis]|uniref:uncharacterized protein n=1 Tax=Bacidia gigantensis TaxID=2732470 RepID=UPI001D038B4C|nr:uncharacterized protein KY384_005771 [Bacidia gigantensis]KAG8529136.1 hypothetical protein KY384_005771 [Bacidia gigantensis]
MSKKSLRIGETAPNFNAETTNILVTLLCLAPLSLGSVLTPHRTENPVSTTELTVYQSIIDSFDERDVKLIVLAPNSIDAHKKWVQEIQGITPKDFIIPFITDSDKKIAYLYDITVSRVDQEVVNTAKVPESVRDIFIIDPNKKIRLIFSYPPTVGSSTEEILRVIDALKTSDKLGVLTGANWYPGANVLVDPAKKSIETAKSQFDGNVESVASFAIVPVSVEDSAAPDSAAPPIAA